MCSDYWHQILYKSVVPFCRFSIFTKRCQKVQLPAALSACFLCAVTVFYVNVQHYFLLMLSVGISTIGHTKLIFIDPVVKVNGSWYRLTTRSGHFARASLSLPAWWRWPFERTTDLWSVPLWSAYHWQSSRPVATASHNCICEKGTVWTSDLNIVIVRLRTSCYWVVVQSYVYAILFTVWFLSNAKTNLPETLHYCLQYIWVCVHKIMFDSVNFTACY